MVSGKEKEDEDNVLCTIWWDFATKRSTGLWLFSILRSRLGRRYDMCTLRRSSALIVIMGMLSALLSGCGSGKGAVSYEERRQIPLFLLQATAHRERSLPRSVWQMSTGTVFRMCFCGGRHTARKSGRTFTFPMGRADTGSLGM